MHTLPCGCKTFLARYSRHCRHCSEAADLYYEMLGARYDLEDAQEKLDAAEDAYYDHFKVIQEESREASS